jgi:ATP-dependent DNA ligase
LARRRLGSCAGKGPLTEAGLKSPIFYSEDFAIDGAAMLEKLSAMQMEGIVSKNVEAPYPSGRNESWLKIKCGQQGKFPIVGFVKDPAGVATLHTRQAGGEDFVYVDSAPASIDNHQWKSARSDREFQSFGESPAPSRAQAESFARIVESRSDALRSSPRSMRGSVSCRWCGLSPSALSSHYSL